MPGLLGACSTMDTIEKVALTRLLLETGGEDALHSHLADPRLCGSCFGLQQNLMACPRGCLRKLCPACFRKEDAGTNCHTCDQTHPATWRAAIRVMKGNTEIVTQWQKASNDADVLTEQVYGGPRQAVQTAEQQIQPQSHESKIATRGRNIKSRRLFPHLFPTGSQMAVFSWRTRSTTRLCTPSFGVGSNSTATPPACSECGHLRSEADMSTANTDTCSDVVPTLS